MKTVQCLVASPAGSRSAFNFEPETGHFKLTGMLPRGLVFPFDFGFVPGTSAPDGAPLQVIIISEATTFTGCALECRVIGAVRRRGDARDNLHIVVVPVVSESYATTRSLSHLPGHFLQDIRQFLSNMHDAAARAFPLQRIPAPKASKLIDEAKETAAPTQIIQLLLPQYDNDGRAFSGRYFSAVRRKLTEQFGGVTIYAQAPATGLWKNDASQVITDRLIIFEVMVRKVDPEFWMRYRTSLEKTFSQDAIMIRRSEIALL